MRTLLVLALTCAVALPAAARGPMNGPTNVTIDVVELKLEARDGDIYLVYTLERGDLRRARQAGASPALVVYPPGERAERTRVDIDRRRGTVRLAFRGRTPERFEVNLVDENRRDRAPVILSMGLGGVEADRVTLRTPWTRPPAPPPPPPAPPPPPPVDYTLDREVVAACMGALSRSSAREQCLVQVRNANASPVGLIQRCGAAFTTSADTLRCIGGGVNGARRAPGLVDACDAAFSSNNKTLSCVDAAFAAPRDVRDEVLACDAAFSSETKTLACVQSASSTPRPIRAAIAACAAALSGERSTEECVASAATARGPIEIFVRSVEQCDALHGSDSRTLSCVERMVSGR